MAPFLCIWATGVYLGVLGDEPRHERGLKQRVRGGLSGPFYPSNQKKDGKEHDKQEHGSYDKLSQESGPSSHLCVLSLPLRLYPFLLPHLRETLTLVT